MSRTVMSYPIQQPEDFIRYISNDFFTKEGFRTVFYHGETVWKHGTGLLVAPSYVKLEYANGQLRIEAWIRSFGEHSLDGFWGFAVKEQLRNRINTLLRLLYQPLPNMQQPSAPMPGASPAAAPAFSAQAAPSPASNVPPAAPVPVPVQVHNPTGPAVASLILGIVSVFGLLSPIVGVVCSILAICLGLRGKKSSAKGLAIAGLVLGIVFLVVSALSWLWNILIVLGYWIP